MKFYILGLDHRCLKSHQEQKIQKHLLLNIKVLKMYPSNANKEVVCNGLLGLQALS